MTNSITNKQMFFILILTLTSYTTIDMPKFMAQSAGRSSWILIMTAAPIFGLAAVITTKLNNMYSGKVMFDYSQEIAGTFVSRAICIYYLLYFVLIGVYLKIRLVNFLTSNFLPKTPQAIVLAISVTLFGFVSYRGITNVARLFELYGAAFLATTITLCVIMLTQGMTYSILPLINPNEIKKLPDALPFILFPFGGIEVLLIIPFTKVNKKASLVAFLTLVFIGLFYILIVDGTVSILGINNTILYGDSFIEAIKVVDVPILERPDIFYLTIGLTSLFAGMIMIFLCVLEYACRILPNIHRLTITVVTGIILYILSLIALAINDFSKKADYFVPYLIVVSGLILPVILFVLAKWKRRHQPERDYA